LEHDQSTIASLARLRPGVRRRRSSTWDRSGGNVDSVRLAPGAVHTLAEDDGPGQVTHLWSTVLSPSLFWGRELVLRMYWDGEDTPSVEVPFGDFFGVGNCLTATYSSAVLETAPRSGLAMHSWFPMPYAEGFRITVENQSRLPVLAMYCYVDHEQWPEADDSLGRFHAWWNRRRGPGLAGPANGTYRFGSNLSADDNYVVLDASGRGHYVGVSLNVHSGDGGWYGEGDDMIFVDSRAWPPTLHGTGTEDYFGTAWSPAERFAFPQYGQPVADRDDWAGFSSVYRFHLADPVPFDESILVTLEQGHANDRRDDWSSVAYWYQRDRREPLPAVLPVAQRLPPWPPAWRRRADAVHDWSLAALDGPEADADRLSLATVRIMQAVHERDWQTVDRVLEWVHDTPQATVRGSSGAVDEILGQWVAGFDAEAAATARLTIGFVVRILGGQVEHQLVVTDGACSLAAGRSGHERLTITTDVVTLAQFTDGDIDVWEAALRGRLVATGDTSMALRLFALFGVGSSEASQERP
jgi:hypothetical protein